MLKVWENFVDNRWVEMSEDICGDNKYLSLLDELIEVEKTLISKLSPEDKKLLNKIDDAQGAIMAHVERKFYRAGICDAISLFTLAKEGVA